MQSLNINDTLKQFQGLRRNLYIETIATWTNAKRNFKDKNQWESAKSTYTDKMSDLYLERKYSDSDAKINAFAVQAKSKLRRRIHETQNTQNCEEARYLFCGQVEGGFGSQITFIIGCLLLAFESNRTMIPSAKHDWMLRYFLPYRQPCGASLKAQLSPLKCYRLDKTVPHYFSLPPNDATVPVVYFAGYSCQKELKRRGLERRAPVFSFQNTLDSYHLPADIVSDAQIVSDNPAPWIMGQFIGFLMQPDKSSRQGRVVKGILEEAMRNKPDAAIHVRKTDRERDVRNKLQFMPLHEDEYMDVVVERFNILDAADEKFQKNPFKFKSDINRDRIDKKTRSVFIATDTPSVIDSITSKYDNIYDLEYNTTVATVANSLDSRSGDSGVLSYLHDLFRLASADFVVCTYTSTMCRLVYELKMGLLEPPCALEQVRSMDVVWYFFFPGWVPDIVRPRRFVAIKDSDERQSLAFNIGDWIEIDRSKVVIGLTNIFSINATNLQTAATGTVDLTYFKNVFNVSSPTGMFT